MSVEDMRTRLGMYNHGWGSLDDVRAAKETISDWVIDAARSNWPQFNPFDNEDLVLANSYARELWPRFDTLVEQLTQAERAALCKASPMA